MERLHKYTIPLNTNGKITQKYYHNHILQGIIKPWLQEVSDGLYNPFILEKDGNSGHSPRGTNIIKT